MNAQHTPTPGTRNVANGEPHAWQGVLRVNGATIWACDHIHHNRDFNGRKGYSALECAKRELRARAALKGQA